MGSKFEVKRTINLIKDFLSSKLSESGLDGYVVGLSGGIDSALSVTLAVEAVGKDRVMAVLMPYKTSSEGSVTDALALIKKLGIEYRKIDISPMVDAYFEGIGTAHEIRRGNKMARERMSILFDIAHEINRLVLGTGNRTEICLGYTTWYGDAACSVNPIGELYKSEVRLLAAELGVPQTIIDKPPSADLWEGQTDEGEIGITYDKMDRLLARLVDDGEKSLARLQSEGFEKADIIRVVTLLTRFSFKRRVPDTAPLDRTPVPDHIRLEV